MIVRRPLNRTLSCGVVFPARPGLRSGAAVLVVLVVLSAALVLSYAVLQSQSTALQVQRNSGRSLEARQVATSGMLAAIRRMHQANWAGVDTTLSGAYGANGSYEVTFTTGDEQIVAGSADDARWPFRVTLVSRGTVTNPDNTALKSTYEIEAVVELVPRALAASPSEWASIRQHTVYQLANDDFRVEVPANIQGAVRLQSSLQLITSNSIGDSSSRTRYASDLNLMRNAGYPDYRPFTGSMRFPYWLNDSTTRSFLQTQLGVGTIDIALTSTSFPGSFSAPTSYQLYAGGKSYTAQALSSSVTNTTLQAAPRTNPLGIFVRNGSVELRSNTTVRGTLVASDRVDINGSNITIEAVNLPDIEGATQPSRLPAIYAKNFFFKETAVGTVRGAVVALEEFQAESGAQSSMNMTLTGRLVTRRVRIRGRNGWNNASWGLMLTLFNLQFNLAGGTKYFPVYAHAFGYQANPVVTIQPETISVTDHCPDPAQPIYVKAASDPGLRWELVRWTDAI